MKQLIYTIVFILIIDLSFQNCANPGRPTGGPKDTIPPTLIKSVPINGTTNFNESTIELEFDEYINSDKLKQQLIITPSTDITYKALAKRNKLVIKLDGELEDSTTYNFNFANGVTDITEKNPPVNLSIAFSTGSTIDSMSISGDVQDLLNQKPSKGYLIGLYPFSDSLDFFTTKPQYFTTTNDSGKYNLNYIKTGIYKLLSFNDDNGNLLLDPETETHGFLKDTVRLFSPKEFETIRTLLQNVKPLSLINARPTGRYVEIKFNKTVDTYNLTPNVPSNVVGENKDVIRLYKQDYINFKDSITTYITASDSLGNNVSDTIKYVFLESNRKATSFSFSSTSQKVTYDKKTKLQLKFNKPVSDFHTDIISIKSDTILTYYPSFDFKWNFNKTQLDLDLNFTQHIADSLSTFMSQLDTLKSDSTLKSDPFNDYPFSIFLGEGTFISVENDTSSLKTIPIQKPSKESTGVLKVDLSTQNDSFWFQLINSNNEVAYQMSNSKNFNLSVKPGTYTIRILIDNNNDGKWSFGNLLLNQEPEEVFIYPKQTSMRENWIIDFSASF